ncbi:YitT family protein [Candidatus Phytoplasma pini]|uniref:YitT family protein n=1 Tax=Candidatus Phytoplasma pini TaxID=267362 RepID=A0A559KJ76_9MOLU|nr:YitT family protein [Candidatus Phytoplasma pini]TVY12157.1 hypothetical protein MDPP_001554 [Candidatus Phytoplasma pini]
MIKKNLKIISLSILLSFLFCLADIIFYVGDYKNILYSTGIYGVGDSIAKILFQAKKIKDNQITLVSYSFFGLVNLFLFIFIAFPKLNINFTIKTLINSIFIIIFGIILGFLINTEGQILYRMRNFFGFFSPEEKIWQSLLRIIIGSSIIGTILGLCIKINSSTGGIDIIAKYLEIYKNKDISKCITVFNFSITILTVLILKIFNIVNEIQYISLFLTFFKIILTHIFMILILKPNKKIINNKNLHQNRN